MTSRSLHRLGLLYAAIPVLTSVYDGYEVATTHLEQQRAINWLEIFVPRLILAFWPSLCTVYSGRQTHSLYGFTGLHSLLSLLGVSSPRSRSS
jgi:hypothetical protein